MNINLILLSADFDEALCVNQHITGLEIAMDNIARMYVLDDTEQLKKKAGSLILNSRINLRMCGCGHEPGAEYTEYEQVATIWPW